ncbi:MAG: alpha/beta hydrolase [Usitatibacter sp.]
MRVLSFILPLAAVLALAACAPVAVLNAFIPEGGLQRSGAIAYGDDARQRLDVYVPRAGPAASPAPVVVFFYGGRWQQGARASYLFVAEALTAQGFVVVVPDYRLYPAAPYPGFLEDGARAVAWTRREIAAFGGDPSRIFLMGHSAGAHIATMLAYDEEFLAREGMKRADVRGVIGLAGPYDFLPLTDADLVGVFAAAPALEATQPIQYVRGGEPASLLITGDADTTVKPGNTVRLAARLREKGSKVVERHFASLNHYTLVARLAAPLRSRELVESIAAFVRGESVGDR